MTIAEAIASCDAQQPNAYSAAEKRRWLSELDGQLYDEVFLTHQDPPSFTPYTADTPQTTQLLLPHPGGGQEARRMGGTGLLQDAIGGDEAVALQPLL